ncbi:hypothetical protein MMC25_005011 [Agyrium rufum]|nr:hypothetical protein [Agyrium rufum]
MLQPQAIVDLTTSDDHPHQSYAPIYFDASIKLEALGSSNDGTRRGGDEDVQIKREAQDGRGLWSFHQGETIDLKDDDIDGVQRTGNINDIQAPNVKTEAADEAPNFPSVFGGVIEIFDDDDFPMVHPGNVLAAASDVKKGINEGQTPPETIDDPTSQPPPPKRRRVGKVLDEAGRQRLKDIQQVIAAKFKNPGNLSQSNTVTPVAQPTLVDEPHTTEDADPHAWMNSTLPGEDDAAAKFAVAAREYEVKKRANTTSWEDDIEFNKLEIAEGARLRQLELELQHSQAAEGGRGEEEALREGDEGCEDDSLFIPDTRGEDSSSRSRMHHNGDQNDNVEEVDDGMIGLVEHVGHKRRGRRQMVNPSQIARDAGIEREREKEAKNARHAHRLTGAGSSKKAIPPSKGKGQGIAGESKKGSRSKKGKASATALTTRIGKGKKPNLLQNIGSLYKNNVFDYTAEEIDPAQRTMVTSKPKSVALGQLIANLPLEDQSVAQQEKRHILRATTILGKRRCTADTRGGWKLAGMKTSLKHHQVLGSAFMKEREISNPKESGLGGLLGDAMGLGKTLTMLAVMLANPAGTEESCKTTLIVGNAALVNQWQEEIHTHLEADALAIIMPYFSSSKVSGKHVVQVFKSIGVVLTTYSDVMKSYPKYDPPKELTTIKEREEWWKDVYETQRGPLHRLKWYRVVLDEGQAIKNHSCQTAVACRGLDSKLRWVLSGTPLQNSVEELYSYFKFLRIPHTGSIEVFKSNFLNGDTKTCNDRIHAFLRQFMIRRTHDDVSPFVDRYIEITLLSLPFQKILGKPIVSLEQNHEMTVAVDFTKVELAIYNLVRERSIKKINKMQREGNLHKNYSHVLTMLLRLRQITSHIFLIQDDLQDLAELEDLERLWHMTASETRPADDDDHSRNMLVQMKKIISMQKAAIDGLVTATPATELQAEPDRQIEPQVTNYNRLIFKFRRILRDLAESSKFDELRDRSACHKCLDVPTKPFITSCLHVYCKECLVCMASEAATDNEDATSCLACGEKYTETRPCHGLKELCCIPSTGLEISGAQVPSQVQPKPRRRPEDDKRWIDLIDPMLPSAKCAAVVAQIQLWLTEAPHDKIIVFTQFQLTITILSRLFTERNWGHCAYHGKMSHATRSSTIERFRSNKDLKIMIASLKSGGVGLNLTCANRVVNVDLWWNSSVEQQAFCRVFRIGQEKQTYITRFVVKNTVDDKLLKMQEHKSERIGAAMGDDGSREDKFTLKDLMRLFGPVKEEDMENGRREFIIVEDRPEDEGTAATAGPS